MITLKKDLVKQIEILKDRQKTQIDKKNLYIMKYTKDSILIISYCTKICEYNPYNNILHITTKKYSQTTTKQQNQIINNFVKYNNSKIIYDILGAKICK